MHQQAVGTLESHCFTPIGPAPSRVLANWLPHLGYLTFVCFRHKKKKKKMEKKRYVLPKSTRF